MRPLGEIETAIKGAAGSADVASGAAQLLQLGEDVLEHWVRAHEDVPTTDKREGFRLLALHRQGAKGVPSFNACRETCRELVYHYNLVTMDPDHADAAKRLKLAGLVANHLYLFVHGKLEESQLGDFCCSSRPLHGPEASSSSEPVAGH